jgi:hypothetical protein
MADRVNLRIRTAKDIIDALRSPDASIRFSMLRAIARNPEKAASYGAFNGQDMIDELCSQMEHSNEGPLRAIILGTLSLYRDPRITRLFKNEISRSGNAEIITMAARYLSTDAEDDARNILSSLLLQNNSPTHAQITAGVMTSIGSLSVQEKIRIALLNNADMMPPALNDETEMLWALELCGPYRTRAQNLIEAQGEAAFLYLKNKWARLNERDKEWLLKWGAVQNPAYTVDLILSALDSKSDGLVLASLDAISFFGEAGSIFKNHTGRFLTSPNSAVRLAACRAGATGVDWEACLAREEDTAVKIEMLMRLTEEKGSVAAPVLIKILEEGDARLRSAAAAALQTIGRDVVDMMKPLMKHANQGVRVAAAQVLIAAGEDLWLEEQVMS